MEDVDCVVAGAGIVGIAVARALALAGREVLVLDAAEGIGTGTSSRNSEVIHAGIYYPKDSLMARFCVQGRRMLYRFCTERGVPFDNCGKLIVATSEAENAMLAGIQARAEANGVEGMRQLSAAEAIAMEPNLQCTAALFSPTTGVIDSHAYMLALQGEAEHAGAMFVFYSPIEGGRVTDAGVELEVGGAEPMRLRAKLFVNSAGLSAPALARSIGGHSAPAYPAGVFRQGELLHPHRQVAVLAADLPGAGARRARRAFDDRSWRPGAVRAGCRVDRAGRRRVARLRGGSRALRELL